MNPNLQYAQAVLGRSTGTSYGVIDTLHLAELAVAIRSSKNLRLFRRRWTRFETMVLGLYPVDFTSTNGVKEMNNANNHSIACFVQLASFAKFTGDEKVLELSRQRFKEVLFPNQMTNDGSFPRELARTKPYGYSVFQADNLGRRSASCFPHLRKIFGSSSCQTGARRDGRWISFIRIWRTKTNGSPTAIAAT